jgi:hypothetical protein
MAEQSQGLDPYDIVLADLRARREQIDQAIQALESLRGAPVASPRVAAQEVSIDASIDTPGAFLGMTIADAAKKLLAARRKVMGNVEMAAAFKAGGLALNSAEPVNTIGAVLSRRAQNIGDIVKMGRGQWGLAEWYPNRNFKKKPTRADQAAELLAKNPEMSKMLDDGLGLPEGRDSSDSWSAVDPPGYRLSGSEMEQ